MSTRPAIVIENLSALQGGGQTYLVNLFRHIPPDVADRYRIVAIVPESLAGKLGGNASVEIVSPATAQKSLLHRFGWQATVLPRLLRDLDASVLYCPGGTLSFRSTGRTRTIVAFRNMLPFASSDSWRYPIGYQRIRNFLLRHAQGWSFRSADAVIFVSDYARRVIDETLPRRRGESHVIRHGVGEQFRVSAAAPEDIALGREYCLYVSTFDVYKAQLQVVEAWARVRQQRETAEQLILVGPGNVAYRRQVEALIDERQLNDDVRLLEAVPYERLPALYQHAKLNIFASDCENCPNILLEALASRRPVLCSSSPPMPEFAGDGVLYFDPWRPRELTDRIVELIDDADAQHRMSEAAHLQSLSFDWRDSGARTWNLLAEMADR